jgi:hypothetical protein
MTSEGVSQHISVIPGVSRDLMYIAVVTHSMPRVEFHTEPYELQSSDESGIVTPSVLSEYGVSTYSVMRSFGRLRMTDVCCNTPLLVIPAYAGIQAPIHCNNIWIPLYNGMTYREICHRYIDFDAADFNRNRNIFG